MTLDDHGPQPVVHSRRSILSVVLSSTRQVCRYANHVSSQVLVQASPDSPAGCAEREEGLEDEKYWAR